MTSAPRPPKGYFNVLYFAGASSFTGKGFDVLPAPLRLADLFARLDEQYPEMKAKVLETCLVTVNLEYVDVTPESDAVLGEGDEVAIIPPVSSG